MLMQQRNIVLIGMPGAGKSTTGILLAKNLGMDFMDTDIVIQNTQHKTLQAIIEDDGYLALRAIEESVISGLVCHNTVIATGGSAVYSAAAMHYLKKNATLVYLNVTLEQLRLRIHNYDDRGIAMAPGQTFEALFEERAKLYHQFADIIIHSSQQTAQQTTHNIEQQLLDAN